MSRRARYEINTKKNSTFSLNITSMTDMFTILLVFLLQSYGTSTIDLPMENGLRLPASATQANPTEAIKMSLSTQALKIGELKIADIANSDFGAKDVDAQDTNFIKPLFDQLEKITKDAQTADKDYVKDGKILLQADRELPYSTIRKVLYTASMAGYPQLKLVTTVGE